MKKLLALLCALSLISGCSFLTVHKRDIEQGNIIKQANLQKIHKGMSEAQVRGIMGAPMLVNVFTPNQIAYVYTNQPGHNEMAIQKVIFIFKGGRLIEVKQSTQ